MITKVLLVYPKCTSTFWNFDFILPYLSKKASSPPIGLLTVAAMLPDNYETKLIDMNAYELAINDVMWADMVFISAMTIQQDSFNEVVNLCDECDKTIVAGGHHMRFGYDLGMLPVDKIDHIIFNEAEETLPLFLKDYEEGTAKKIYKSDTKADLTKSPIPKWDLIDVNDYWMLPIQYSRGCPFNCDFCDVIEMYGRQVRTKTTEQTIKELDALYQTGFVGLVFFVDDNFIGTVKKTKELLIRLVEWQKEKQYPFGFCTQVSVVMARDEELMKLISDAGFSSVFVGIESSDTDTLANIQKSQNTRDDLLTSVRKIQAKGIMVMAGIIVGFDSDTDVVFDEQIAFIQKAGIPIVQVNLLVATPNTQLYRRLKKEKRLIGDGKHSGDSADLCLNYAPLMPEKTLIEGYKRILSELYKPKNYYDRFLVFLEHLPKEPLQRDVTWFRKDMSSIYWQAKASHKILRLAYERDIFFPWAGFDPLYYQGQESQWGLLVGMHYGRGKRQVLL